MIMYKSDKNDVIFLVKVSFIRKHVLIFENFLIGAQANMELRTCFVDFYLFLYILTC